MGKTTNITGYGVTVEPETWRVTSLDAKKEICDQIAKDIRRHVDNVHSATVTAERESVCEYCGWKWTEHSDSYNGGCCDEDEKANPNPDGQ